MGNVSQNFSRSEFRCNGIEEINCGCGRDAVDVDLVNALETIRRDMAGGSPVQINSGNRCHLWNTHHKVNGSPHSQHLLGKAADFWFPRGDVDLEEVYAQMDDRWPKKYGMGLYRRFIHLDVRPLRARWLG